MAKKAEASLFERFVIMLMGLGVMLVGAYPLTKEHGGIFKYLKTKGIQMENVESYFDNASKRARLKYKEINESSATVKSKKKTAEKPLDSITNSDKEHLNKLLDDMVK